jgi:imidazolonepropionase-like amidohydrolase
MIRRALVFAVAVLAATCALPSSRARAAVPTPGAPQSRPVAIVDAAIHPVSGPVIDNGTIVFDGGRIVAVGASGAVAVPPEAERVDGRGLHVYPSLVDPFTPLGLTEISSVRATVDSREVGRINPGGRAEVAYHPESDLLPVTRSNGVLVAGVAPDGSGLLPGQAAAMMLDGWTWEDATLRAPIGMVVNWPGMLLVRGENAPPEEKQKESRDQALRTLRAAFADARAYQAAKRSATGGGPFPTDLRWEAMVPVLERKVPLFVVADEILQIEAAVAFAQAESLRLVLVGGYDAPEAAVLLARHDVPVIVSAIHRLPRRRGDPYDTPYTVPARLAKAGVRFAIANGGAWNERNLPYAAATAAAYGLPADQALRSITLDAASILGIADRVGSLEPGKDATLFVTTGDPLEQPSQVVRAWIGGRAVDLNDRQKTLNEKYREKYRRLATPAAAGNAGTASGGGMGR